MLSIGRRKQQVLAVTVPLAPAARRRLVTVLAVTVPLAPAARPQILAVTVPLAPAARPASALPQKPLWLRQRRSRTFRMPLMPRQ